MAGRKPVEILYEPDPEKACEEIKKSALYRRSLVIVGDFLIRQDGSQTHLNGERLLMIKSDWTIIVHRDNFFSEPILAWEKCDALRVLCGNPLSVVAEKEESEYETSLEEIGDGLNKRTHTLEVEFSKVYAVMSTNLVDGTILMEPGDSELLTAVLLKPEIIETGFKPLPSNGELKSGFVDLIGIDSRGNKTVVYLSRKEGTYKKVAELSRYIASVRRHVTTGESIRGILAAPSISEKAKARLVEYGFEFKKLDLADVGVTLSYYRSQVNQELKGSNC